MRALEEEEFNIFFDYETVGLIGLKYEDCPVLMGQDPIMDWTAVEIWAALSSICLKPDNI